MDQADAERVLRLYTGGKLTTRAALPLLREWALAKGMTEDRWGNFHMEDGHRIKFTKQRMRVEGKGGRGWSAIESYPLIDAGYMAIRDAAKAAGRDDVFEKARGSLRSRRSSKKKSRQKRLSKAKEAALSQMAKLIASSEDPFYFYEVVDEEAPADDYESRVFELSRELRALEERGKPVTDADVFSASSVPAALLHMPGEAQWIEEVDGVAYSIWIKHREGRKATIEIGTSSESGFGGSVDPLGYSMHYGSGPGKGDAYISGYVERLRGHAPVGILFMIVSHNKQHGAGSRVLDIWCDLMAAFGVERWAAKAVGEEGEAFFAARERAGRLRRIGSRGSDIAFECEGGPRGRQTRLSYE